MSAVHECTAEVATWQYAAVLADLDDGVPAAVEVDGTPVCLVRQGHRIHALLDICSHQDYPLSQGEVAGDVLECCVHGACFDLTTGSALTLPATEPVPVYPVKVCEGEVFVMLTELHAPGNCKNQYV